MANIEGIAGMSPQEISFEVNRGGKFVRYRYCFSVVVITVMESTNIYFVRCGESRVLRGLRWTLLTVFAGWWGIPWGPIRSVQSLWINLHGGEDLTAAIANSMRLTDLKWDVAGASQ